MFKKEFIQVLLLSLLLLMVGLLMLQFRWVNPDEGAHISDARLLLEGKVPLVDFQSRQPFYILLLAVFLKIFSISYLSCRLLPLLSSLGVSILIYLIGKKLYDKETGFTSQILYVFLPFTILYAPIVKMHNIVVFWGCLGLLLYILFGENKKIIYLILSGFTFGLAFYVRESSLAGVITIVATIILVNVKNYSKAVKQVSIFLLGFFAIIIIMLAIYLKYMTVSEFWNSSLNPFYLFLKSFAKIGSVLGLSVHPQAIEKIRIAGQDISTSIKQIKQIFRMNLYLFFGFALFLYFWIKEIFDKKIKKPDNPISIYILPIWFLATFFVYGYYFFARGFFPAYATELYPQLIIGLSFLIVGKLSQNRERLFKNIFLIITVSYSIFIIQKFFKTVPDLSAYFIITFTFVFIYWYSKEKIYKENKIKFLLLSALFLLIVIISQLHFVTEIISGKIVTLATIMVLFLFLYYGIRWHLVKKENIFVKFFATAILVAALFSAFGESARYLNISFDTVWSPETVRKAQNYLDENTEQGDTLLSGAMIWAVNPKITPYFNITHPTAFISEVDKEFVLQLKNELLTDPPQYVVMDTFTEKCFRFIEQELTELIKNRYEIVKKISDPRYSISIYKFEG